MAIQFQCPECKVKLQVADQAAGKKVKCKCGQTVDVPSGGTAKPAVATAAPVANPANTAKITVSCKACQRTLQVPGTAAGKGVKCPCGTVIPVPVAAQSAPTTAKAPVKAAVATSAGTPVAAAVKARPTSPAAATPVASPSLFDELTDKDWEAKSAPVPKADSSGNSDGSFLRAYMAKSPDEAKSLRSTAADPPAGLKTLSGINFFRAVVNSLALISYFANPDAMSAISMLIMQFGMVVIVVQVIEIILNLLIGIGLLTPKPWGWWVASVVYIGSTLIYGLNVVIACMGEGVHPIAIIFPVVWGIIALICALYLFRTKSREFYGVRMHPAASVAICIGIDIVLLIALGVSFYIGAQNAGGGLL